RIGRAVVVIVVVATEGSQQHGPSGRESNERASGEQPAAGGCQSKQANIVEFLLHSGLLQTDRETSAGQQTGDISLSPPCPYPIEPLSQMFFKCGSSASRIPSPTRLKPSTQRKIAIPGKVATQGAVVIRPRPALRIDPQEGSGGCAPSPRKLSPASTSTA